MNQYAFSTTFGQIENGVDSPRDVPMPPKLIAESPEGFRIERLNLVWGHACAMVRQMSKLYQHLWQAAIVSLEDSKGVLIITWTDTQSRLAFEGAIVGAWEANGEHCHEHHLASA